MDRNDSVSMMKNVCGKSLKMRPTDHTYDTTRLSRRERSKLHKLITSFLLVWFGFALEAGDGNGDGLRLGMRDGNTDLLDARCLGGLGGMSVEL